MFAILQEVLTRLNLSFADCIGQCFDGAASVSEEFTVVQKQVRDVEPRAVFMHCQAHSLNLVVQDAITLIASCRDIVNDIWRHYQFCEKVTQAPKLVSKHSKAIRR